MILRKEDGLHTHGSRPVYQLFEGLVPTTECGVGVHHGGNLAQSAGGFSRHCARENQAEDNAVHFAHQPGKIPPRPPLVKGGWGDLLEAWRHCSVYLKSTEGKNLDNLWGAGEMVERVLTAIRHDLAV